MFSITLRPRGVPHVRVERRRRRGGLRADQGDLALALLLRKHTNTHKHKHNKLTYAALVVV